MKPYTDIEQSRLNDMTQAEKAKRYDVAVKVIKDNLDALNEIAETGAEIVNIQTIKNCFYRAFPELRESDDERIRKAIIEHFVGSHGSMYPYKGFTKEQILAWLEKQNEQGSSNTNQECLRGIKRVQEYKDLSDWEKKFDNIASMYAHNKNQEGYNNSQYVKERADAMLYHAKKELEKQGEQKPVNKVEPKFKVGDWVIDKQGIVHQIANVVENVTNHTYGYDIVGDSHAHRIGVLSRGYFNDNTEGVRLWTIEDAKDGDVLADGNLPFIFKKIDANKYSYAYCGISVDDGFKIEPDGESGEWTWMQDIKPATKEQREQLEKAMTDAGYTFDFEKKELKEIEHKHFCELDNSYACVKFPFKAKVKSSGTIVTIYGGQLSIDCKEWIKYQSDAEDGYKVYEPNNLELVCDIDYNPAWGEKDNRLINEVIELIDAGSLDREEKDDYIERLKSLKDRIASNHR